MTATDMNGAVLKDVLKRFAEDFLGLKAREDNGRSLELRKAFPCSRWPTRKPPNTFLACIVGRLLAFALISGNVYYTY